MKKLNKRRNARIRRKLVLALAIVGVTMLLPMSSVYALKKATLLEMEVGSGHDNETEEEDENESESAVNELVSGEREEAASEQQTTEPAAEERMSEELLNEDDNNTEHNLEEQTIFSADDVSLSVEVEDDIEQDLVYQNDRYVKRITHTIILTENEKISSDTETLNTVSQIYKNISYTIYEETSEGEVNLREGSLEIPSYNLKNSINKIEMVYTHAGDYCIKIKGCLRTKETDSDTSTTDVELACHNFSIKKSAQSIDLNKSTISLSYGDMLYIDDIVNVDRQQTYEIEYEIEEESEEKNKILEIGKRDKRDYIKAIGLNASNGGTTAVTLRLKENPFMEASEEKTLSVHINPMKLNLELQTDVSQIYMYDILAIRVTLQKDGRNVTEEIFEMEQDLGLSFRISSKEKSCVVNSRNLNYQKGTSYIYYIPVKEEYFKEFSKGIQYNITAELQYNDDRGKYFPYEVNIAEREVELLGRRAILSLSAENNGIYDYRTYYKGIFPNIFVGIEDTTPLSNKVNELETGKEVLSAEVGKIIYHVSSSNKNVMVADNSEKYTAKDSKIPLCVNRVGTTTLTVTADGSSVYSVDGQEIEITVENSPLYDEDFVISIVDVDGVEKQSFQADKQKTGFQKWQEYLTAHDGWIANGVNISLTDTGLEYYELIRLMENENDIGQSKQLYIGGDTEISEYVFWAENDGTNADTSASSDEENGVRSFRLGIDTTAPAIKSFVPPTDYYAPASTEAKQYFPKSFVLTGLFTDATSGITTIEYTTDFNAENGPRWELLERYEEINNSRYFKLELQNGSYNAIAVRAVDAAGNISEPVCLKNENGEFIKVIVDDTPPNINVWAVSDGENYSAEGEHWTNKEVKFYISEKSESEAVLSTKDEDASIRSLDKTYAELYKVEYAYQSIAAVLCGEPIADDEWHELEISKNGIAELSVGGSSKNPINQNGCYYFRGVSRSGVKSDESIKKRILLWQEMAPKKPLIQTGADIKACHNEWYNKESGTPIIDFEYPEYDTGVTSGEYAAPITIHYNLKMKDEKNNTISLADNKTASIQTYIPESLPAKEAFAGFTVMSDELTALQITLCEDGIYMLEYWTTDAAGNESEVESVTYKIDCHKPAELKVTVADEELLVGNENTLLYEKFYQSNVSGQSTAEYGISGKGSLKLLKAKKIGDWDSMTPAEDAEQFVIEPNTRCLLYIRATDGAGNMTEGWTRGIVVDNKAPIGENGQEMIIEPEGANKHGFFNKDVKVNVSIKDAPTDGNSAALRLVTSTVGTDSADTISDKVLLSSVEETVSEELLEETEGFMTVEIIDSEVNEGNEAYLTINAADRAGNVSTSTQMLKIDVTKPEIEITFDNENAVNGRYYSAERRAKITIRELNFDSSLVEIEVKKDGEAFNPSVSSWQSDKDNHYAYIDFTMDGDYMVTVGCRDLADNEADKKSAEPFTIDKTMPRVDVTLENKEAGNAQKGYFNGLQTAIITVVEHNFNTDDIRINVQPTGKIGEWEHNNDTHVIKIELLSEGEYNISCEYKDLAGNDIAAEDKAQMPLEFVIDRTAPTIEISGVENNSANAGEIVPIITVLDVNAESADAAITLTTGRGKVIDIISDITTVPTAGGFLYTLKGLDKKSDDIYYLKVSAGDKAGNTSELTYRFSLNRRGSAYDLTDLERFVDKYYNSYNTLEDIKIIEMNVDKVEDFELYMSYNTDIIYGKAGSRPMYSGESGLPKAVYYNVDISGNEDTGYVYTYTIYRENFSLEGIYRLGIYSRDRAGNEVNNLLKLNSKEIQFVVDNTMPRVVIDGVENNKVYDVESQEVRVIADDNFKLAAAELILVNNNNEILESWNYFDLVENEGDTAIITIGEHKEEVSLLYRAEDMAGNKIEALEGEAQAKTEFLVTTDKLVQLVNKPTQTPLGRLIIIAATLLTSGLTLIVLAVKGFRLN